MSKDSTASLLPDRVKHTAMNGSALARLPKTAKTDPDSPGPHKQRVTVFLPSPLIERLRNAVYWIEDRTLARIITEAVEHAVTEMEQANGGHFPVRLSPLKPGRPRRRPSFLDSPSQE